MHARCLVPIGLSVRAAAEAARRDGWQVIGLDAFGDADTRSACHRWARVALAAAPAAAGHWQLDLTDLDRALRRLAPPPGAWLLPGSGLPQEGATLAPWLAAWQSELGLRWAGSAPAQVAALRDPRRFFAALDALQIAHPPLRFTPPERDADRWLRKDAHSAGGAGVRPAAGPGASLAEGAAPSPGGLYWQRRQPGQPLSLTALGDGRRAALLGLNRQLLAPTAARPWRFGGLIGPLPWSPALRETLQTLADRLVARFELRGLFSLDGIGAVEDGAFSLLEINPRWPASAQLYGAGGGLVNAVVEACQGRLPQERALELLRQPPGQPPLRAWAIAYADAPLWLTAARRQQLHRLAGQVDAALGTPTLHDLPPRRAPACLLAAGDPICSVSAAGCDAQEAAQHLAQRLAQVQQALAGPDAAPGALLDRTARTVPPLDTAPTCDDALTAITA